MPEPTPRPTAPTEPKIEVKPEKDLEPDESQSENVRGGNWGAKQRIGFSDAALKRQVSSLRDALAKLREL